MTNADHIETFFPNQRRRAYLKSSGTHPLVESLRAIRLGLRMSMTDGKLIGVPEWLGKGVRSPDRGGPQGKGALGESRRGA